MLGQLDAVNTLNRMLLVLTLFLFFRLLCIKQNIENTDPLLKEDHPISLSVSRKCRMRIKTKNLADNTKYAGDSGSV